jgi:RimJ/RimL family protein N-acetyltransferase
LVPLALEHLDALAEALLTKNTWHGVHWNVLTRRDLEGLIGVHVDSRSSVDGGCAFAMISHDMGLAVGMSRFMNIRRKFNSLEIGGTWIGEASQRTSVNTEAKILMLAHAFEYIKCQRVEFRVDSLNFNSQRAVLRIGAKYEGEMRQAVLLPDGRKRDYRLYSILDCEWENIKRTLCWYMEKYDVHS